MQKYSFEIKSPHLYAFFILGSHYRGQYEPCSKFRTQFSFLAVGESLGILGGPYFWSCFGRGSLSNDVISCNSINIVHKCWPWRRSRPRVSSIGLQNERHCWKQRNYDIQPLLTKCINNFRHLRSRTWHVNSDMCHNT